ncbi:MAG: hypothetical protein U0931_38740 [Vulcanimicrobiota bacterium]
MRWPIRDVAFMVALREKQLKAEGGSYAYLASLEDLAPLLGWRVLRNCPQGPCIMFLRRS